MVQTGMSDDTHYYNLRTKNHKTMKILVLNCGSSSIKYALYNMDDNSVMTSGGAERVGLDGAFVKVKLANGEKKQIMHDIPEHTEGVKFILSLLTDPEIGVIKSLEPRCQGGCGGCQNIRGV